MSGQAAVPQDGLFAILIHTSVETSGAAAGAQREMARRLIRHATREALAAVLALPLDAITITSRPGQPPVILLAGCPQTIGLSFAHDGNQALAAVNLHGAIGADLMRVQDIPDWQAVSKDYLGPATTAALAALTPHARPHAFTSAWTQREAALKCHGLQLSEWQADLPGRSILLALPVSGLLGHIHIGDKTA